MPNASQYLVRTPQRDIPCASEIEALRRLPWLAIQYPDQEIHAIAKTPDGDVVLQSAAMRGIA